MGAKDDASNDSGEATGAVYLYSLDAFTNGGDGDGTMTAPEPFKVLYGTSSGDEFGNAVALSSDGSHLAVGSRSFDEITGAIRIYQIIGNDVSEKGLITGGNPSERAGWSVAVSDFLFHCFFFRTSFIDSSSFE